MSSIPLLETNPTNDVGCLFFKGGSITHLQKAHLRPFPKLQQLRIEGTRLNRVDPNAFEAHPAIEQISLVDNHLTTWPPVAGLNNLKILEVQGNMIQSLEVGQLDGCPNLDVM